MATKQINQLISATAIEDTDSIPIQTLAGLTKKFTPATLKTNLDGRYQQLGEVVFDVETGVLSVSSLTMTTGNVYEIHCAVQPTNQATIIIRLIYAPVYTWNIIAPFAISDMRIGTLVALVNGSGFNAFTYDINHTQQTDSFYIKKIIDMGVAQ